MEAAAAAAYGVADPAMVAAAPGTQSLIQWLARSMPRRRVAVLGPTYAEHAAAWNQAGSIVRAVRSLDAVGDADVAVVVNPNNPDGVRTPRAALLALAARLAVRGGVLIVDEAFADLEDCSLAPALPQAGLLLLRSFGKTYGLAGVRLGFLLGDAKLAAQMRAALGPWAVSGPAIWAGRAALADGAWRAHAQARLAKDGARLDRLLGQAGLRLLGGTLLFRLAALDDASGAYTHLAQAGILVRRFPEHPHWLRFGLPPRGGWDRLQAALHGWRARPAAS